MSSKSFCSCCYSGLAWIGCVLQPFLLLAIRVFWGMLFIKTGMEKFAEAEKAAEFFKNLSIPLPLFTVYFVGFFEVVCGAMLVLGLAARLATIPLIVITVTAFLTAHVAVFAEVMTNPEAIVKEAPFNFLLASLIVLAFGPGLFSIDAIIKGVRHRYCKQDCDKTGEIK